jgi:hypothetical protein
MLLTLVGLGLLVMGEVFLVLLIFLGVLLGISWIFEKPRGTNDLLSADNLPARVGHFFTSDPSPVIRRLSEVRDYSDAVVRLRVYTGLSADQKLAELGESYAQTLERLANAGQLTEDVETAFRDFAEKSATAVTGLAADFGSSLQLLVKTHYGRYRRRLR